MIDSKLAEHIDFLLKHKDCSRDGGEFMYKLGPDGVWVCLGVGYRSPLFRDAERKYNEVIDTDRRVAAMLRISGSTVSETEN